MRPDIEHELLQRREAIAALCRAHGIASLEVFGSAAEGRFDPARSDYDFIVRFAPRARESLGRRYIAFSEALERLLGRSVDVMTDHPIENPYLRAAVDSSRRLLYANPAAETSA